MVVAVIERERMSAPQLMAASYSEGGAVSVYLASDTTLLRIPVQVTRTSQGGVTRVTAKDTGIVFDQGSVVVSADAPLDAIQNAAAQKAPGADGTVAVDVKVPKVAEIAN